MPTFRSHKCCTYGGDLPFGTVSYIDKSCEIHVLLRKKPCCDKEFESLLTILRQVRQMIGDRSFIILYTLRSCTFDRRYMSPQEDILHGAKKCALICNSSFFRFVILSFCRVFAFLCFCFSTNFATTLIEYPCFLFFETFIEERSDN